MAEFPWLELGRLVFESVPAFLRQTELLVVIVVVLLLVHMQYKRIADAERRLYGVPMGDAVQNTLIGLLYGIGGGLLATFLFVVLGISLIDVGIGYLWVLAIVLMTIHPRFLCFSYAGGLLSTTHLLFGWPVLNVPAVMGLVAVLHLVESVLIWIHGARDATPVYVRRRDGRVAGGFTLQKFWPMPFIALIAFVFGQNELGEATLAMPDWWPLIKPRAAVAEGMAYVYMLFPVIAALGYGDLAITREPKVKARRTAAHLLVYSVVLMGLALLGGAETSFAVGWQWLAAIFAVAGHEAVIHIGRLAEEEGDPVYDAKDGAVVLGVVPGTPAEEMGLRTGDVIRTLNGFPIRSGADLRDVLTPWAVGITLEVDRPAGGSEHGPGEGRGHVLGDRPGWEERPESGVMNARSDRRFDRITLRFGGKVPPFGVILAPDPNGPWFMNLEDGSRYGVMLRNLGRRVSALFGRR